MKFNRDKTWIQMPQHKIGESLLLKGIKQRGSSPEINEWDNEIKKGLCTLDQKWEERGEVCQLVKQQ